MALISLSTGWLPRLESRPYYEVASAFKVMRRFSKERLVDGFEFGLLPEWDCEDSPLTPTQAPPTCEKHTLHEILELIESEDFEILTVHANRDVGSYLCLQEQAERMKGVRLMDDSLEFCQSLDCEVCVFHFWDPWKESFDIEHLHGVYQDCKKRFSDVDASIENIPTVIRDKTPFSLMQGFEHVTLDLKWASMFNEFDLFIRDIERVDNVHIQGKCVNGNFVPSAGNLDYDKALKQIIEAGYSGAFTVELEGKASYEDISEYIKHLRNIT